MKKRSFLLTLAAMSLLASCGSPSNNQGNSNPEENTSLQPGQSGQASVDPSTPGQTGESLFAAVKDSPKNVITHERFVEFYNRVIKGLNSTGIYGSYKIDELTLPVFEANLTQIRGYSAELINLFEDALKVNRLTDGEWNALLDSYVYGMAMTRSSQPWYAEGNYNYFLGALKNIDLDHVFKTILDLRDNGWDYRRIANFFTLMGGYGYSGDSRFGMGQFNSLLSERGLTNQRVKDYLAAQTHRSELTDKHRKDTTIETALTLLTNDNVDACVALVRLAKRIVLSVDENCGYAGAIKLYNLVYRFANQGRSGIVAPSISEVLEAAHLAGKVVNNILPVSASDIDRLLQIAYDDLLLSFEASKISSESYIKSQFDGIKSQFEAMKRVLSGNGILAVFHFVGNLATNFDQSQYESIYDLIDKIQRQAVGAEEALTVLARAIEKAYADLPAVEKTGLGAIASYFGLDLGGIVNELQSWAKLSFEQFAQKAQQVFTPAIQKISSMSMTTEYSLSSYIVIKQGTNVDPQAIIDNRNIYLYRYAPSQGYYYSSVEISSLVFRQAINTSSPGYQKVEAVITTKDGVKLEAVLTVEVRSAALFNIETQMMVLKESDYSSPYYDFYQFDNYDKLQEYFGYNSSELTSYIRDNVLRGDSSGTIWVTSNPTKQFVLGSETFSVDFSSIKLQFNGYRIYDAVTMNHLIDWAKNNVTGTDWTYVTEEWKYVDGRETYTTKTVETYIFFDVRLLA